MVKLVRLVLLTALVLLVAVLAGQNTQSVSLRFLVWETAVLPVWVYLLAALAVGMLVGGAALFADYVRLAQQVRRERRRADVEAQRAADEAR
ncbi:MAG TPA: LapA family protein, partial [Thermodesulfobacteriota bacterium]|nr:LapA family protein [Thermodesulfobacteriota bacterium]